MDQIKIGEFIAEMRKEKGWTQRELAERLAISDKTVSKWESGRGLPDISLLLPLCDALGITVNELLSAERQTPPDAPEASFREQAEATMLSVVELAQDTLVRVQTDHRRRTRRLTLTLLFLLSLAPMLFSQFGGARGVQEISGAIILASPLGLLSVLVYLLGVWLPALPPRLSYACGGVGALGMIAAEVWQFCTWYIETITGQFSWQHSVRFAFPAFYVGLAVSVAMAAAYFVLARPAHNA